MRNIIFYHFENGKCPVADFLESLSNKQVEKIFFVLDLIETIDIVPRKFFKKLESTDLWEVRIQHANNIFRILGFFDGNDLIVLKHAFTKKNSKDSQKRNQNSRAKEKRLFFKEVIMSDLQKYKQQRMQKDPGFWKDYDKRFETFKLGILLKQARIDAGMTQKQIAQQLKTSKSVISRMENHATDIRLSTLEKFAKAVGRDIRVALV